MACFYAILCSYASKVPQNLLICRVTELGLLSGIAAILRFPISDPDDNEEENGADSLSDSD